MVHETQKRWKRILMCAGFFVGGNTYLQLSMSLSFTQPAHLWAKIGKSSAINMTYYIKGIIFLKLF